MEVHTLLRSKNSTAFSKSKLRGFGTVFVLILLSGLITWWKWPVKIPGYQEGQSVQLVFSQIDNTGASLHGRSTTEKAQIQAVSQVLQNVKISKKILQPFGVPSSETTTKQMRVSVFTPENGGQKLFLLSVGEDGAVSINGGAYTILFSGTDGRQLYSQLYRLYESTLQNHQWSDATRSDTQS